MTMLALVPDEDALVMLTGTLGSAPLALAGVAELIRDEVTARGACPRAATLRRVCKFVSPAATLEEEFVGEVCDLLERQGDVVLADGGVLFATPLRAVNLGDGTLRLASSLSTRRLANLLRGDWTVLGTARACRVADMDEARSAVDAAGGVLLSPDEWSCFDRVPSADDLWLGSLDRRLSAQPEAASSLERDEPLAWSGCIAATGGIRWKAAEPGQSLRLWRARNRWGHWHHAWTREGSPATAPFVSLRPDESTRSVFAVARALGAPVEARVERREQEVTLTMSQWLPFAEYRYLSVSASLTTVERGCSRWTIPVGRLAAVLERLGARLGLVVREETAR